MTNGYCTVDDVRRVFQDADLTGALEESDNRTVVDAIESVSRTVEWATLRHWYAPDGVDGDAQGVVAVDAKSRDDEHDIPTHGGFVIGDSERRHRRRKNSDALMESGRRRRGRRSRIRDRKREIRISTGDVDALKPPVDESIPAYTRLRLGRKDVSAVSELLVIDGDGAYEDWAAEKTGGIGQSNRGDDWWVRINNKGVAELYLDVHAMDDDIASFANAVYVDIDYGQEGLPMDVRRGVAHLAAAELVVDDELVVSIPDNGQLVGVETKADRWERIGKTKLEAHIENPHIFGDTDG